MARDPDAFADPSRRPDDGRADRVRTRRRGGVPLLLLHGYPETKRIWWRNIAPLAAAGFDVVVPDLRGYGDSGLAPDGFYDPAAYSRDTYELAHDVLGFEWVTMAAGDVGGVVMLDMDARFPGFVRRQCFFNSVAPSLGADL